MSANAHRLAHASKRGWWCSAKGCPWRPGEYLKTAPEIRDAFARHLYELVPKRGRA